MIELLFLVSPQPDEPPIDTRQIERPTPVSVAKFDVQCALNDPNTSATYTLNLKQTGGIVSWQRLDDGGYRTSRSAVTIQASRDDLNLLGSEPIEISYGAGSDWNVDGSIRLRRPGTGNVLKLYRLVNEEWAVNSPTKVAVIAEGERLSDDLDPPYLDVVLHGECSVAWESQASIEIEREEDQQ